MKKIIIILQIIACCPLSIWAQNNNVGIGTTSPDPSAILDLNATDKGFLVPRLSIDQESALPNPANGLLIYREPGEFSDESPSLRQYYDNPSMGLPAWRTIFSMENSGVDANNYMGLGVVFPSAKLHVVGNIFLEPDPLLSGDRTRITFNDSNFNSMDLEYRDYGGILGIGFIKGGAGSPVLTVEEDGDIQVSKDVNAAGNVNATGNIDADGAITVNENALIMFKEYNVGETSSYQTNISATDYNAGISGFESTVGSAPVELYLSVNGSGNWEILMQGTSSYKVYVMFARKEISTRDFDN